RIEFTHRLLQRRGQRGGSIAAKQDESIALAIAYRPIDGALIRRVNAKILHRADDADDGRPRAGGAAAAVKPPAANARAREEAISPRAIDDDDVGGVRREIGGVEQPAFLQAETDGREKFRRDADPGTRRLARARRRRMIFEIDVVLLRDVARRPAVGERHE